VSGIHPATYLFAARALRDFGDGFVAILLPVYLLLLGFSPLQVGIIATASLFGSALLTIAVGFSPRRRPQPLRARCLQHPTGIGRSSSVLR
jgi:MFS family permease